MNATTGWCLALVLLAVIAGIVILTARWKVNALLVLFLASVVFGVAAFLMTGNPPLIDVKSPDGAARDGLITVIAKGFGGTLTKIGLVILFGTIIGYILERSGAAFVVARSILALVGKRRAPLAIGLAGCVISVPVFCDSGFIILAALNRAIAADAGISLSVMATALSMGLYSTHTMVPPTPGPLAAAGNVGADVGLVMLFGLIVALPSTLVGVLFAKRWARRFHIAPRATVTYEDIAAHYGRLPSPVMSFLPIVLPVGLIALASLADLPGTPFGDGAFKRTMLFLGNPIIALAIGMVIAMAAVPRWSGEILDRWVGAAIKEAALILAITAAGGSLGETIRTTGLGDFLGRTMSTWNLGLLLPFVMAAALKTAQGSSTVSLITTSAILAPLLPALGWTTAPARAIAVLAIAAGSMVVSHANDSYFWVVSQFSDMDVTTAYKTQTLGSLVVGIAALACVMILSFFVL